MHPRQRAVSDSVAPLRNSAESESLKETPRNQRSPSNQVFAIHPYDVPGIEFRLNGGRQRKLPSISAIFRGWLGFPARGARV